MSVVVRFFEWKHRNAKDIKIVYEFILFVLMFFLMLYFVDIHNTDALIIVATFFIIFNVREHEN